MANIDHEIKIKAPQERVYQALASPSGLSKWHTSNVKGNGDVGGTLRMEPKSGPVFEWKVTKTVPSQTIQWECVKGPGRSVGTSVEFKISPTKDGRTLIEFVHSDWQDNDEHFRECNTLWAILLDHLRRYAETQKADPTYA
jgi:uncharacterized protein YndB with AHSA1/START domain